jgi:hypothetical protein
MHRPTLSFAPPTIASSTSPGRLRANNIEAIVVDPGVEARHPILELIREGAEVHAPCRRDSRTSGRSPS